MNLSNKLTFSLVFSVFLVAALVAAPAMAQVMVTAQVTERVNQAAGPPIVQGKRVVTIKYSVNAWPELKKSDITTDGSKALDDGVVFAKVDAKTFKLTFLGSADGATTDASISSIQIDGYEQVSGSDLNSDSNSLVADPVVQPAARTIAVAKGHLASGAFLMKSY